MNTKTAEEIRQKIYAGHWRPREVSLALEKLGGEIIFDALYGVFLDKSRGERHFTDQEIVGKMLYELQPKTSKGLKSLVRDCLENWNLSVEELPFYFRDVFGKEKLEFVVNQIESNEALNEYESKAIKTIRWWCKLKSNA